MPAYGGGTNVVAVIANLTAVAPTQRTFLTLYPANLTSQPNVSDVSVNAGEVLPNLAVVALDTAVSDVNDGKVFIYNSAGTRQRDHRHRGLVPVAAASFASRTEWRCGVGMRRPARPVGRRIPWGLTTRGRPKPPQWAAHAG